ncbi:AT-rich interactive domain-containing protein 4B-like isoform X2 [Mizuhopecten yessoensis]|uniref:AT-rich interactive domain-containing protein 4B n=1 Tax=Mizuhopecten yessoensis TaxID=6573 RepID=A0A210PPK4_MIZYE|nr:AT-rich interactive domain-containing protein 4B-like isoform X2 [Mizuhopecten yessoensis]OWF38408.1 AT-rich interactive domain-containing protein 4B [Mizuhopecten yessoensis]
MAGDDPPFLVVGTEVSAKYRGAFCEAKVKKLVKSVKCKVFLKETQSSLIITDDGVKGVLKNGSTVEVKNPETGMLTEGVINRLTDTSMYTVVFDDGDEKTLRRTQLCLKGEKHFIESETLDNLPLSHPEHFGTPVMSSKKAKRGGRHSMGNDEEEDTSSDESIPKRPVYKGRLQNMVGRVMLTEMGDKRKQQVPVLVVLPDAHSTELRTKDHLLIKSFKDGKFYSIARKDMKEFSKDTVQKNEDKTLKAAFEKCIAYYDNQDLPSSWERDELLGTDEEEITDDEESSDDEPSEEKDRFVAQLYKFMDDRGTPINKGPTLGNKDLNLYKLFKVVQNIGGYNKVTNQLKWRGVYAKMSLPPSNTASHQIKTAYKKYLHAFEDFYRKLGSSMGTISRPGRSRSHSGRGMHVPFKKESDKKGKDPPPKKEEEAEEKTESDTGETEGKEVQEAMAKRERSPIKRTMRHEATPKSEEKVKKEEVKEKKVEKDESTPKKTTKKEPLKKDPDSAKKTAKAVKKEKEEEKKARKEMLAEQLKEKANEEKEKEKVKEKVAQEKKVVRRRSMRKDEKDTDSKGEEESCKEEEIKKEKPVEKETKPKAKPVIKDEKKDKKEEKKEDKKEVKITRKELKKAVKSEEEPMEIDKPKVVKKDGKKTKVEEDKSEGSESEKPKGTQKKEVTKKEEQDSEGSPVGPKKEIREVRTEKTQVDDDKDKEEDGDESESDTKWPADMESRADINAEFANGTRLQVRYGRGRNQKVYDAKVVEAGLDSSQVQYLVHYAGWNMRYDEWIKPERIVNIINRPDSDKKVKDCSPKGSKQQLVMMNKKRGRPGSTPPQPSPPKPTIIVESRPGPVKARSPASSTKAKSRPTRSNSVEFKVIDGLPPKWRRTRRNSGVTESDVNSQGSDFEDSDQSDMDADEKEDMDASSPEIEEMERDTSVDSYDEDEDKGNEKDVDASSEDMPKLEKKADELEIPNLTEVKDISEEPKSKTQGSKSTAPESAPDVIIAVTVAVDEQERDKQEVDPLESAPQLEAVEDLTPSEEPAGQDSSSSESDNLKKDVFKWDIEEEEGEGATTKEIVTDMLDSLKEQTEKKLSDLMAENAENDEDIPPVMAPVLEKQVDHKVVNDDIDKPAPEIRPEVIKAEKQQDTEEKEASANDVFDKYEFRDDEEEITLPDLRAEAEKELKEKLKQEAGEIEKRIIKGKKKEVKEKKECKEKEKKEVKKGKMTMAERKMVILPEGTPEIEYEPPQKKAKEEKPSPAAEKVPETSTETAMSTLDKVISSVCDKAREFVMEETEGEKKKVKKKVKKKEAEVVTPEVKRETAKKETSKGVKPVKGEKTPNKGKGKKSKDGGEGETEQFLDSPVSTSVKTDGKNECAMSPSVNPSSHDVVSVKTRAVIDPALESNLQMLSGVELLSGIALMNANVVIGGRMNYGDPPKEVSSSSAANTVLDNTPPTTPEHDDSDGAQCASRDHSSSSQESQNKSELDNGAENERQLVGGESPHGNASPSSNDGSVGSGNVACSESSNLDVPVSSNLGKRRKESEEPTPTKKKRKAKSKTTSERKTSKTTGSDSDEGNEGECSQDPNASNSKLSPHVPGSTHSPRPSRYNLNLEEGKYLEGEKRISFLMEKIQEIRKVYMNLKAEVACIDRRRKRARRKESAHHSSTAAETEYCR